MDKLLEREITTLERWVKSSIIVETKEHRSAVITAIADAKGKRAKIVEFFADSKAKSHAAWKSIVAHEKSFTDRLDEFERAAKLAVNNYDAKEESARLAEQDRLQKIEDEKARKEKERLEARAKKAKGEKREELLDKAAMVISHTVTLPPETEKREGESSKKIWHARVIDLSKVPREYLIANEKQIEGIAKATRGPSMIPGVEFYFEMSLSVKNA